MSVEIIETKARADAIAQAKHLRHQEDVVGIEFLNAGKTLRVTRSGEAEDVEAPADEPVVEETVPAVEPTGQVVESDVAGTGEAVNAETGEVTAPGEPLPVIEAPDGVELEPASTVEVVNAAPTETTPAVVEETPVEGETVVAEDAPAPTEVAETPTTESTGD